MEKKTLLIADDEEMNRMIISKFLKNDFHIIQAADGEAAYEILRTEHVDALLLDIIMPKMDGLELLKLMRQDRRFDPIGVLVATSTKEKTERTALSLGADDIVSKPYDPIVIRKRMDNILAMKEIRAQKEQLQTNDMDSYLKGQSSELAKKLEISGTKIMKFADIINANKSNLSLVGEITESIKAEVQKLLESVSKDQEA